MEIGRVGDRVSRAMGQPSQCREEREREANRKRRREFITGDYSIVGAIAAEWMTAATTSGAEFDEPEVRDVAILYFVANQGRARRVRLVSVVTLLLCLM